MFGSIGMPEMLIILIIALIIFGPRKLPELGRSLGKSLAEFKKASNELRNTLEEEIRIEEQKEKETKPPQAAESPAPTAHVDTANDAHDAHRDEPRKMDHSA
jgi:sec-independent protein translocase protein TatA